MNETLITAEDLTLYAMRLLESTDVARVELLLRSSTEAREELALIRGDLATFALSAPQHTPPALTKQRLLKQVAREGRTVPIPVAMQDVSPFKIDASAAGDVLAPISRMDTMTAEERRNKVKLPRIHSEPEPMFEAAQLGKADYARPTASPVPAPATPAPPLARKEPASEDTEFAGVQDPRPSRRPEAAKPVLAAALPAQLPEDRYEPSTPFARSAYVTAADSRPSRFGGFFSWMGWGAAAALAAAGAFLLYTNTSLHEQMDRQAALLSRNNAQMQRADVLLQTLQSPAAERFVLARQDAAPAPGARVAYLPEHGSLVFQGTNLEPLAAYKTYELWLIPAGEGRQPVAAGTFKPDARGYATLVMPSLPKGTVAGNFGVTIEDDGGSVSPTLPILLIGQQG